MSASRRAERCGRGRLFPSAAHTQNMVFEACFRSTPPLHGVGIQPAPLLPASVRRLRPPDCTGSRGPRLPLTRCPAVQDRLGKERFGSLRGQPPEQTWKDCPGAAPDHACACVDLSLPRCLRRQGSPIRPAGQVRATGGKLVVPLCWDSTAEGLQTALTLGTGCGEVSIFRVSRPKQTNRQTNKQNLCGYKVFE